MAHAGVEDLPMVGGHAGLDLINTVEPRYDTPDRTEHLRTPDDLLVWVGRAGLLLPGEVVTQRAAWAGNPAAAQAALHEVLGVREATHRVLRARLDGGLGTVPGDLERLARAWREALGRSTVTPSHDTDRAVVLEVGTVAGHTVGDRVAWASHDLLVNTDLDRLRACPHEHGGCGWMFLDRSRNRSRRWCVMADCGTRVKASRLTARRRAARNAAAPPTAP